MRRIRMALALIVSIGLIATACGDGDSETAETTATTQATTTTAPAAVAIAAVNYAYEELPDTVQVGQEIKLINKTDDEVHEIVAIRLPEGETRTPEDIVQNAPDIMDTPPSGVWIAMPESESEPAVGNGTFLIAGRYIIFCAIPTGADPDEFAQALAESTGLGPPRVEGGDPHFVNGMIGEITVEAAG